MNKTAEGFDDWYSTIVLSPRRNAIQQRALGLPAELESTSLLTWDGIADVVVALQVEAGQTLVDLACGLGGYGREVASRTGADLVGIDFSSVAVAHAATRAPRAQYLVGDLLATGLGDASAQAIMCVDAMQFAEPYEAGLAECRRVLVPGGRLVLTGWQALDADDEQVPVRLRRDIGAALRDVGFEQVDVHDMTGWRAAERAMWTMAIEADPQGDPAMQSLHDEGTRVLRWLDRSARVLAVARCPEDKR